MSANENTCFCRKCGKQIPAESVFCRFCGEKTEISNGTAQAVQAVAEQTASAPSAAVQTAGAAQPNAEKMTFCQNCGRKCGEDEEFCLSCGSPLSKDKYSPTVKKSGLSSGAKAAIIASACGLGVLIILIIVICVSCSASDNNGGYTDYNGGNNGGYNDYNNGGNTGNYDYNNGGNNYQGGTHTEPCWACYGTGKCNGCDGTGLVWGWKEKVTHTACQGTGICPYCSGTGQVTVNN